jgi:hypothetical protein
VCQRKGRETKLPEIVRQSRAGDFRPLDLPESQQQLFGQVEWRPGDGSRLRLAVSLSDMTVPNGMRNRGCFYSLWALQAKVICRPGPLAGGRRHREE